MLFQGSRPPCAQQTGDRARQRPRKAPRSRDRRSRQVQSCRQRHPVGAARVSRRDLPELLRVRRVVGIGLRAVQHRRPTQGRQGTRTATANRRGAFPTASRAASATIAPVPRRGAASRPAATGGVHPAVAEAAEPVPRGYSFAQLRDICDVLSCTAGGVPNPDFIRQLAAFQMLRDQFGLDLTIPTPQARRARWTPTARTCWRSGSAGGARSGGGRSAADRRGRGARARPRLRPARARVRQAADRESRRAVAAGRLRSPTRPPTLARAADAQLRFAEVLAKIYASDFRVGELLLPVHRGSASGRRRSVPAAGRERGAGLSARPAGRRARALPLAAARRAARGRGREARGRRRGQ